MKKKQYFKFIDGIYIDGRKDATLLTEHDAQKLANIIIKLSSKNTLLFLGNLVRVT